MNPMSEASLRKGERAHIPVHVWSGWESSGSPVVNEACSGPLTTEMMRGRSLSKEKNISFALLC